MDTVIRLASLAVAVLVLWRLAARGGTRNVLLLVTAFFVFFAYGPVINLLLGNAVYPGTVLSNVNSSTIGFTLALIGVLIGDTLMPQRRGFDDTTIRGGRRVYLFLPAVYLVLSAYGLFILVTHLADFFTGAKAVQIAAAGPFHYRYLLLDTAAVSTFYMARQTNLQRQLWGLNVCVYVVYCLLTSERDFFFVLAAVVIHREMLANKHRTLRLSILGLVGVVSAAGLFALRSATKLNLTAVLNQGSILFVDSYIHRQVPSLAPHRWGETYLQSIARTIPIIGSHKQTLSQWFAHMYAPSGSSAYGFSLTGEAFLNFGTAGVAGVFLLLTLGHRFMVNRADQSDWWAYASIYTTAVWMYVLRGDSTQLTSSMFYGLLFFAALQVTSIRKDRAAGLRTGFRVALDYSRWGRRYRPTAGSHLAREANKDGERAPIRSTG